MLLKGGQNICGYRIGVISLESYFFKPPGHIKAPATFDFPVSYRIVDVTVDRLIETPGPELIEPFVRAAQELEAEGCAAITGSCGFLALYQRELAEAVSIPVFISSLIQVPLVHRMLPPGRSVGVMTASRDNLGEAHLEAVGAGGIPVTIVGMDNRPEFSDVILKSKRLDMDSDRVRDELLAEAAGLLQQDSNVGAIVLECTDMAPYGHAIQQAARLPVFDLTTLTNMVAEAVARRPYPGFSP